MKKDKPLIKTPSIISKIIWCSLILSIIFFMFAFNQNEVLSGQEFIRHGTTYESVQKEDIEMMLGHKIKIRPTEKNDDVYSVNIDDDFMLPESMLGILYVIVSIAFFYFSFYRYFKNLHLSIKTPSYLLSAIKVFFLIALLNSAAIKNTININDLIGSGLTNIVTEIVQKNSMYLYLSIAEILICILYLIVFFRIKHSNKYNYII